MQPQHPATHFPGDRRPTRRQTLANRLDLGIDAPAFVVAVVIVRRPQLALITDLNAVLVHKGHGDQVDLLAQPLGFRRRVGQPDRRVAAGCGAPASQADLRPARRPRQSLEHHDDFDFTCGRNRGQRYHYDWSESLPRWLYGRRKQ